MEPKQTLHSASVLFLCMCVKWVQPYAQHEMCTLLSPCANVTFACISTMLCTGGGNWSASTWAPDSTSLWCHLLADVCHLCTPAQPYTCQMTVNSIGLPMCFMSVTQVCMRNPSEGSSPRMMQPKPHHSLLQHLPDFVILSSEWRERYPNLY